MYGFTIVSLPDYNHVYGTYPGAGKISAHLVGNSHISLHNDVVTVRGHCATPRALVHDRSRYHFFFSCAEEHHATMGHSHEGDVDPDNDGIYQVETRGYVFFFFFFFSFQFPFLTSEDRQSPFPSCPVPPIPLKNLFTNFFWYFI
jgi:hypothetical protein